MRIKVVVTETRGDVEKHLFSELAHLMASAHRIP